MTESALLQVILQICANHDVLAFHSSDSRRDIGKGFPDLVLVGQDHVLFIELKVTGRYRKPEQTTWGYRLKATGAVYDVWTPRELNDGTIKRVIANL